MVRVDGVLYRDRLCGCSYNSHYVYIALVLLNLQLFFLNRKMLIYTEGEQVKLLKVHIGTGLCSTCCGYGAYRIITTMFLDLYNVQIYNYLS